MKRPLLHIVTGLSVGGAETTLLKVVERLHGEFSQHVMSLTEFGPIGEKIAALGVPVHALGFSRRVPNPLALLKLSWQIRRFRPAVVQTWMYHADLLGGLAARLAGVRAVVWNIRHNDFTSHDTSKRTRQVMQTCAYSSHWIPSRIICCSRSAMDTHVSRGYPPDRLVLIPNGFDIRQFVPDDAARKSVRSELKIPEHAPIIGMIARYNPDKNHKMFFTAAGLLNRRRPDAHFVLAGRGIDRGNPQIGNWVAEEGIGAVVRLLGERADIPRLTAAFDIASSSSRNEAFPNVLGEAMACGVPCVATDVGDAGLIVGDTGRIVPPDKPEALAKGWEGLLSLPATERRTLGERARTRVREHFELGAIAERYAAVYRELARGNV